MPRADGRAGPDGSSDVPTLADAADNADARPGTSGPRPGVCENLQPGPFVTKIIPGIEPAEDITFDDSGVLYWARIDGGIMKSTADGKHTLFVPRVEIWAGMRWTPSGDLYIEADSGLERVSPQGTRTVVVSGGNFNGLEVDREGRVYATDLDGERIIRYDPKTNKSVAVSMGVITKPNGITFNREFDTLFVSNWGGHIPPVLHQLAVNADGTVGPTRPWVMGVGSGTFDGMAVDECGNIYVADSDAPGGQILRFTPDGKKHTVVVNRPGETLHNFMWGRGKGWSEDKLYIVSLGVGLFEADVGVRGKKYW